jgi:hypothetical protein
MKKKIKITENQANKLKKLIKENTFDINHFIKTLVNDTGLTYEFNEDPTAMRFDIAEAIFIFIQHYNEDHPFIHFLNNLLHEWMFRPGLGTSEENLEYYGKMFYETLVNNEEIYKQKFS